MLKIDYSLPKHLEQVRPFTALVRKLNCYANLTPDDLSCLASMIGPRRTVEANRDIIRSGEHDSRAFVVDSGWVCTYTLLPDGSRQIIDIGIPGDIMGLRNVLLQGRNTHLTALVSSTLYPISTQGLLRTIEQKGKLAEAILWSACLDTATLVERLVDLGRRSATERLAHFMLELHERLHMVGLCTDHTFLCPLTQCVMADVLGLTTIHLNRTLRALRDAGMVTFRGGIVDIHDPVRLARLAGYEASSVHHLHGEPIAQSPPLLQPLSYAPPAHPTDQMYSHAINSTISQQNPHEAGQVK